MDSYLDGLEAFEAIKKNSYDLLLLDISVPGLDGLSFLEKIHELKIFVPTIFISALVDIEDISRAYNLGCYDYLKKPFELKELDLRINNIKRLFKINDDDILSVSNDITIDKKNLLVKVNDKEIHISVKELNVLEYLMKHKNKPISVDELTSNIWSYENTPLGTTIRTYIKNLRKVLGEEYITNIRGVGYRFNSE